MNVAIIVPARIGSTRFPKKLLHKIKGKPVIVWTADRIKKEAPDIPLFFAVDHESLAEVLGRDGYEAILTDPAHTCGTDRIAEANRRLNAKNVINVQADEPLVTGGQIRQLVELIQQETEMATLGTPLRYDKDYHNPNHVKLVCDDKGYAIYFSRAPIPYLRDTHDFPDVAAWLLKAGGAIQVANEGELHDACWRLLSNPEEAKDMGERARAVVTEHQGATERVMRDLAGFLAEG